MPKKPQVLAGQTFLTKKALQDAIKKILHQSPLNKDLQRDDYRLVRALLDYHPSADIKIGCGVVAIQVVKFKPYNNRGFELVRLDGTKTDFSYRQCLNPESKLTKLKRACRFAVSSDIVAFRDSYFALGSPRCEISGEPVTRKTCHIDHAPPWTFRDIFNEFIQVYKIDIDKIRLAGCDVDGATTYDIEHPGIKSLWVLFHRNRAVLRILHKDTHMKITKGETP